MGLFNNIKNLFKKNNEEVKSEEEEKITLKYDEGLTKSRDNFVSKLMNLTNKKIQKETIKKSITL